MIIVDDFKVKAKWLYGSDEMKYFVRAVCSDASLSMVLYRGMWFFNKYKVSRFIAGIFCKTNAIVCGAVIGRGASFGKGFVLLHSVGVVINSKVVGGENIIVESGVVIGEEKRRCPVLGSNLFVGSGAKIFGAIKIGENVTIGANAVVNKNVQNNVVVGGVPAQVLRYKETYEI